VMHAAAARLYISSNAALHTAAARLYININAPLHAAAARLYISSNVALHAAAARLYISSNVALHAAAARLYISSNAALHAAAERLSWCHCLAGPGVSRIGANTTDPISTNRVSRRCRTSSGNNRRRTIGDTCRRTFS
ncbi:hypothetical protein LSAT2_024842, partial [Lamellibrachia satsuma]